MIDFLSDRIAAYTEVGSGVALTPERRWLRGFSFFFTETALDHASQSIGMALAQNQALLQRHLFGGLLHWSLIPVL